MQNPLHTLRSIRYHEGREFTPLRSQTVSWEVRGCLVTNVQLVSQGARKAGVGEAEDKGIRNITPDLGIQVVNVLTPAVSTVAFLIVERKIENLVALGTE